MYHIYRLIWIMLLFLWAPLSTFAYTISCGSIPEGSGCNQCFRFELATSNGANDVFVPRSSLSATQQEYIDLSQSTITAQTYQGSSVSPVGDITASFDRIESGPNAKDSWTWAKMKWQMISKNTLPTSFDSNKPLYGIKYKTVSYIKNSGQVVSGSHVTHNECGFFFVSSVCGNGVKEGTETCDDGNTNNNDSCSNTCKLPICGNSIKEGGEECDDGNTQNGDSCSSSCRISGAISTCWNGIKEGNEECDDANASETDTCSSSCKSLKPSEACRMQIYDSYWSVPLTTTLSCHGANRSRSVIIVTKNNQVLDTAEVHSKSFTFNQSGKYTIHCFPAVDIDPNLSCNSSVQVSGNCGNGIMEQGEMCDDGNKISGDSCDKFCRLTGTTCGNGILEFGEDCDDGNNSNNDTCSNICQWNTPYSGPKWIFVIIGLSSLWALVWFRRKNKLPV